ncbi:MAG: SufE family protein [Phycisphaerales bacterium]|nr:SufE family protein [Phycisphaerales bacterium]
MSEPDAAAAVGELTDAFSVLDQWEDRYRYIMDLGEGLAPMDAHLRTDETLVRGCQSTVWVALTTDGDQVRLHADSDSALVKGLAAIVVRVLDGRTVADLLGFDLEGLFDTLQLHAHLSPTRSNGLHGMVRQVMARAGALAKLT